MLVLDSVCVYSSSERDRAMVVAAELRRSGVSAELLPSARVLRTWEIEVADSEVAAARQIIDALGLL